MRRSEAPTGANFVPLTDIGFLPLIETDLDDYSGTIGVRGEVAGWGLDLSAGRGHNSFDYKVRDTVNASFGPDSQSTFDAAVCATARISSTSTSRGNSRWAALPSHCPSRWAPSIDRNNSRSARRSAILGNRSLVPGPARDDRER